MTLSALVVSLSPVITVYKAFLRNGKPARRPAEVVGAKRLLFAGGKLTVDWHDGSRASYAAGEWESVRVPLKDLPSVKAKAARDSASG